MADWDVRNNVVHQMGCRIRRNKVGQAYVQAAPERMVWGSNWPHPNTSDKPDDAVLLDLLREWAPKEATRHRILIENPEALYRFAN